MEKFGKFNTHMLIPSNHYFKVLPMVMEILRHALTKESDYTFANCYLYNHVGNNWAGNEDARAYIKPSIQFLAGCLESVKKAMNPVATRGKIIQLLHDNFPEMLPYVRQESQAQGLGGGAIEINETTPINLDFFIGSLNFYMVGPHEL